MISGKRYLFGPLSAHRYLIADTVLAVLVVVAVSLVIGLIETLTYVSNISNLYIIAVALLAARRGLYGAVVASILAFLLFDWFFVEPLHTFTVHDPAEYVALGTLLVTSIVIGRLVANVRQRADEALRRQKQTQLLYEVGEATLSMSDAAAVAALAVRKLNETLGLRWSRLLTREAGSLRQIATAGTPAEIPNEQHWLQRALDDGQAFGVWRAANNVHVVRELDLATGAATSREGGALVQVSIPLRFEDRIEGMLVVGEKSDGQSLTADDRQLLVAFANQLALAQQRWRLARQEARARAMEESDRLKSALISSVSHELKTPLAAIKASVTSLFEAGSGRDGAVERELKESINRETDRLTRLVSDLLDMSRLEGGALHPHLERTSISDVISDVLDRMEPLLNDRRIEVHLADPLPPTLLDFVLVGQVLTNLLDNALRYAPPTAQISISAEVAQSDLRVTVFNEGSTVPDDGLDRVFEKFFRLGTDTGGTGLGLSIARGIVEALGGRIWAENVGRRGIAFTFTLPAQPPSGEARRPPSKVRVRRTRRPTAEPDETNEEKEEEPSASARSDR